MDAARLLMAQLHISLDQDLKARLEARAAESGYASIQEYVDALVRADLESIEPDDADLEQLLLRRMDAGPGVEFTAQFTEQFKREVRERREGRRRKAQ